MKYIIGTILAVAVLIGMIVFIVRTTPKRQCVREKEIIAIDVVPQENFWGKKITYIIRYSDGTIYETELGNFYGIGQKTCIEYK